MKPIGPLMREHRLIERMVSTLNKELKQINAKNKANVELLTVVVDFFRTYADRTHKIPLNLPLGKGEAGCTL